MTPKEFKKKKQIFKIGKVKITECEDNCIMLTNDDEGTSFAKIEFEELLKELLYKHF